MTLWPPPTRLEKLPLQLDLVAAGASVVANARRERATPSITSRAGERELGDARGLERRLDVHPVIDDVRDELRRAPATGSSRP